MLFPVLKMVSAAPSRSDISTLKLRLFSAKSPITLLLFSREPPVIIERLVAYRSYSLTACVASFAALRTSCNADCAEIASPAFEKAFFKASPSPTVSFLVSPIVCDTFFSCFCAFTVSTFIEKLFPL